MRAWTALPPLEARQDQTLPKARVGFRAPMLSAMSPQTFLFRQRRMLAAEASLAPAVEWAQVAQPGTVVRARTPTWIVPSRPVALLAPAARQAREV